MPLTAAEQLRLEEADFALGRLRRAEATGGPASFAAAKAHARAVHHRLLEARAARGSLALGEVQEALTRPQTFGAAPARAVVAKSAPARARPWPHSASPDELDEIQRICAEIEKWPNGTSVRMDEIMRRVRRRASSNAMR